MLIARTLMVHPELLFLDEAMTGLDLGARLFYLTKTFFRFLLFALCILFSRPRFLHRSLELPNGSGEFVRYSIT